MAIYHVVCHSCTFERIVDGEDEAQTDVDEHGVTTDHDVEYAEVA